jgi:hypothetical protein
MLGGTTHSTSIVVVLDGTTHPISIVVVFKFNCCCAKEQQVQLELLLCWTEQHTQL